MGIDNKVEYPSAVIPSEPFELLKCQQRIMYEVCGIKDIDKIDTTRSSLALRQLLLGKVMLKWGRA